MVTFNVDSLDFVDDEEARFGADTDFATRFDSANSRLELEDLTNATVGYVPQNVGTDLVGGKFAETVDKNKALADDGNVYDSVQEAVASASSWVKIGPGYFTENVEIQQSGMAIVGSGERTVLTSTTDGGAGAGVIRATGYDNILIRDIKFDDFTDDALAFGTVNGLSIINCTFERGEPTAGGAIDVGDSFNVRVHNCRSEKGGGFRFWEKMPDESREARTERVVVTDCTVNDYSNGYDMAGPEHLVINCVAKNCTRGINQNGDSQIMLANQIENCEDGILLVGASSSNSIVANNVVVDCDNPITDNGTGNVLDANQIV